jgi:hypothetical protein
LVKGTSKSTPVVKVEIVGLESTVNVSVQVSPTAVQEEVGVPEANVPPTLTVRGEADRLRESPKKVATDARRFTGFLRLSSRVQ